jgi:hypothetical protein
MKAQRFQQVQTGVRRTMARHALVLGLSLSLLGTGLAAQRSHSFQMSDHPM